MGINSGSLPVIDHRDSIIFDINIDNIANIYKIKIYTTNDESMRTPTFKNSFGNNKILC